MFTTMRHDVPKSLSPASDRWPGRPHSGWVTTLDRLARHGSAAELPVIIERTTGLIVDRLLAAGHPVVAGASHRLLRCPSAVGSFRSEV